MPVRPVTAADVPQVIDLVRTTLTEFGLTFGEGSETDAQLAALPGSYADGAFFVATNDAGSVIGTAGIAPVRPGVFELRKMYLAPAARGQRLGQALFDACRAAALERRATMLVLDTTEKMTAAIRFYEKNGFQRDDAERRGARCSRGYRLALER